MLRLNIFNQRLSYFSDSEVVADSKGFLAFTLETSEDWATYVGKTVQFTRDGVTYSVTNIMDNIEYAVPWEVLVGAGTMYVNAFATKAEGKRATTNQIAVEIIESGLNEDSLLPEDPTPSVFEQYVEDVQENATAAHNSAMSAENSANTALNYKNSTQQLYQQTVQIKSDIEGLNTQVEQAAQNAFQSANSAQGSAQAASQSEINAAAHASNAQQYAADAAASETLVHTYAENAKTSENNANSHASRAEANQIIVTETKEEIDVIYADMQDIHADVTNKHSEVLSNATTVAEQAEQVQNYYNNFVLGCKYVEFTSALQTEEEDGWVLTETEDRESYYMLELDWQGEAILNIQIKDSTGMYSITPFVDVILDSAVAIQLKSIAPFEGRIMCHTLVESEEIVEK